MLAPFPQELRRCGPSRFCGRGVAREEIDEGQGIRWVDPVGQPHGGCFGQFRSRGDKLAIPAVRDTVVSRYMAYQEQESPNEVQPPVAVPEHTLGKPCPWTIGESMSLAWNAVKRDFGVLVFSALIGLAVVTAPGHVVDLLFEVGLIETSSVLYVGLVGGAAAVQMLVSCFFSVGMMRMFLAAARGQDVKMSMLWSGGDRFLAMLGTNVLVGLAVFGGLVFAIVPGLILGLGLPLSGFFCVDRGMGPVAAIRASWLAMSGSKMHWFGFAIVGLGISLCGLLAFGVGYFVAVPVLGVATAVIYLRLTGQPSTNEWDATTTHWRGESQMD